MNTHKLTIICPIALYETASKIGQATDSDIGGARNFDMYTANKEHCITDVNITVNMAGFFDACKTNPALLHGACVQDFETRWQNETPPSLEDVTAFIEQSNIYIYEQSENSLEGILSELNLTLFTGE